MENPKYKRVLLKISGEALAGEASRGLDFNVIGEVCDVVKRCVQLGVQVGIVVGGGNFWRGLKDGGDRMVRVRADHMGMLATAINALAVADVLEQKGVEVRVQTAIEMRSVAEPYIRSKAIRHLEKGRVVIFGCGTGNPFFSTDQEHRRRLLRRPQKGARRGEVRIHHLLRRAGPAAPGHGLHRHLPVHGQQDSRAAVCPEGPGKHSAGHYGREDRNHRPGLTGREIRTERKGIP